jgi:hypothetical protein
MATRAGREPVDDLLVASAAVWLRLLLIDRRGHDGAVAAIGVDR